MPRILVVDDSDDLRSILADALEQDHTVFTAGDGAEGLALFNSAAIDLVLTDMSMPKMSGPALIAAIKHQSPQTPIIGMTGGLPTHLLEPERQRLGIQGFFSKPMSLHDLRRSIRDALQAREHNVQTAA